MEDPQAESPTAGSPLGEGELRAVFQSLPDAILLIDPESVRIVDCNQRACELYGYDREDVRGVEVETLCTTEPTDDSRRVAEAVRAAATGDPQVVEGLAEDSEGEPFWIETNLRSTTLNGEARVLAVVRDVTERKRRQQELEEEHERYSALVEQSPAGVVIVQDEEFKFVNRAMAELTGRSVEDLRGRPFYEVMAGEYRDLVRDRYEQRIRGEGPPRNYEVEVRTTDDGRRIVDLEVSTVTFDGEPATMATFNDVTEQRKRERELRRQNERLERIANVVSHDLRNPLSVAVGHAELLEDDDHAPVIQANLERMEAIIADVLRLARDGQAVEETEQEALSTFAKAAWRQVETEAASLTIVDDVDVEADRDRVKRLFENLFRNSVQHAGGDVEVRVGAVPDGFYVEDDGPGIPEATRSKVFEAGYTTAEDGTGLGLNIVQEIAAAHDWTVEIADGIDGGARFEFTGPAA